jgi:DNA polymerase-3 subunit epsilon
MRQVILDTETTGLDFRTGDRVVEIGCIEMIDRRITGARFHAYINPGREVPAGAVAIHGLTDEFLADKPKFMTIADEFIAFVRDAELIIHNAPFDLAFLNTELGLLNLPSLGHEVIDTLVMAKELHPGKRNNLDALCERYSVNNAKRTLHGALLDAELLAEVYLAMTRGQESLIMALDEAEFPRGEIASFERRLIVVKASDGELAAHDEQLAEIDKSSGGACVWKL